MATDPGTHPGGAILPGSLGGIGNLPGEVQWTESGPRTTLAANPFETPLWGPGSLFSDPSAGFVAGLGATATTANPPPASQISPVPVGTDPVTGQPDWVLPDVNVGAPSPPYGSTSGSGDTTTGTTQQPGIPVPSTGTGTGAGVTSGLSQIGAFTGNWLVRLGIIAAGLVLIAAAAWNLAEERTA